MTHFLHAVLCCDVSDGSEDDEVKGSNVWTLKLHDLSAARSSWIPTEDAHC